MSLRLYHKAYEDRYDRSRYLRGERLSIFTYAGDEVYTLEVDFPYTVANAGFSDCFHALLDVNFSTFSHFFYQTLPVILQSSRDYLNLWIIDPTVCLMVDKLSGYFFVMAILFYFKSNLQKTITRAVANITATVLFISILTVTILHITCVSDRPSDLWSQAALHGSDPL